MKAAFVLVGTEAGAEREVLAKIRGMRHATEAYTVYGSYDIVVKVEAETAAEVKEAVERGIRRLEGVRSTLTMLVTEQSAA
ncbi:MAG: Lrp/AsnC ligand binding domain-containing protein [Nitrososphaerota archaeon]|jgi:DNA-binding Lrp family transcriptional regulator|nr:Lrp/AsnC ligand binding domain-containing protein [Nitrososphaerota archaeon]